MTQLYYQQNIWPIEVCKKCGKMLKDCSLPEPGPQGKIYTDCEENAK